ncbi:hypothetical protein OsI_26688 [Oryza sativa Indica Group]|uniref:Uncharacterized protein n=1 Tax=Oryza sativa subsp. indica TaxID=39946 RepID=B8B807_ORYSI|nr:hypothetical protein OsI_26688 [Oryza sativa Indica Group]
MSSIRVTKVTMHVSIDSRARLVPDHQRVDRIRTVYRCDADAIDTDLLCGTAFQASEHEQTRFPVVVIIGVVSAKKPTRSPLCLCGWRCAAGKRPVLSAWYLILLEEKNNTQIAFRVKLGDYQWSCDHCNHHATHPSLSPSTSPRTHRAGSILRLRLSTRVQWSSSNSKKKKKLSFTADVSVDREDLTPLVPAAAAEIRRRAISTARFSVETKPASCGGRRSSDRLRSSTQRCRLEAGNWDRSFNERKGVPTLSDGLHLHAAANGGTDDDARKKRRCVGEDMEEEEESDSACLI